MHKFFDKLWLRIRYEFVLLCYTDEAGYQWLVDNKICLTWTGPRGNSVRINAP